MTICSSGRSPAEGQLWECGGHAMQWHRWAWNMPHLGQKGRLFGFPWQTNTTLPMATKSPKWPIPSFPQSIKQLFISPTSTSTSTPLLWAPCPQWSNQADLLQIGQLLFHAHTFHRLSQNICGLGLSNGRPLSWCKQSITKG